MWMICSQQFIILNYMKSNGRDVKMQTTTDGEKKSLTKETIDRSFLADFAFQFDYSFIGD